MNQRMSIYDLLGLPPALGVGIVTLFTILALSPYAAGQDFGVFKVPTLSPLITHALKYAGLPLLLFAVAGFIPLWSKAGNTVTSDQIHMIASDLQVRLREPYADRQMLSSTSIRVEVSSGTVVLGREAKLLEVEMNKQFFVQSFGRVELITALPDRQVIASSAAASVRLDFDISSLIPEAYYASNYKSFVGKKCGTLRVAIPYRDGGQEHSVTVEIPVRFSE